MSKIKYLRVSFSKDAVYDIPTSEIIRHYAQYVLKQISSIPLDEAIEQAKKYFDEDEDRYAEFASHGMTWCDVVLNAITINKGLVINKDKEWVTAKKELIEL